jgi:hypothetical protein
MSFSMGINQGTTYLKNSANKLLQGFKSKTQEGFDGILGKNNDMANVISGETIKTGTEMNNFNNNIAQYGTDYDALTKKTNLYLNDSENSYNLQKNYNVFINKSLNQDQIQETNQLGCVRATNAQANIKDIKEDPNFKTAYPNNFTKYSDADAACKLWGADTGSIVYAVNKYGNGKDFQCFTGSGVKQDLQQYTKPNNLYTLIEGDVNTNKGGLFGNGQIGGFSIPIIDQTWNINNMTPPKLLYKYNNSDYSNGPQPSVNERWWGVPSQGGWGINLWPGDKSAWWISTSDHMKMGTMGYFYYIYNNGYATAQTVLIYAVIDDKGVLKINGVVINSLGDYGIGGRLYLANLAPGKNVFELELVNTGGPGAFVFYVTPWPHWYGHILFTSGSSGWGYKDSPGNYNSVTIGPVDPKNPYGIKTANPVPTGHEICDPFLGGKVNPKTIGATYGKNCSGQPMPPASSCHGWDCSVEGQKCLKDSPGAGNVNWRCNSGKWSVEMPPNLRYILHGENSQYCLSHRGGVNEYATGRNKLTSDTCDGGNGKIGWSFIPLAQKDRYMIKNQDTNVCLFNNGDGRLGVAPCVEAYNDQHWQILPKFNSWKYQLQSVNSGRCLYNNSDGRFGVSGCNQAWNDQLWQSLN